MAVNYYDSGFAVGKAGAVGRPPYDPRDPRTMIFVNQYNRGYDDGCSARLRALTRRNKDIDPKLLRSGKSL